MVMLICKGGSVAALGLGKVFEQCLLCAAVQNMKKIALVVNRKDLLRLVGQTLKHVKGRFYSLQEFSAIFRHIVLSNLFLSKIENPA